MTVVCCNCKRQLLKCLNTVRCHCTFECVRDILVKTEYTASMYLHLHYIYMNTFLWSVIRQTSARYETHHNKSKFKTNITDYTDKL
jgi:hypothetical protein